MARKDSRGYALKKGESQRKDGRYVFRYTTIRGEQKAVYAKELSELRKKEVKIRRAIEDGLDPDRAERITLNELFDEYISQKYDLKQSTLTNYKYMYNHYVRVDFGKRRISKIKYTDVKKFYYSLIMEKGFKPNSMEIVNTLLHPTFTMAVRDGLLRLNPTEGVMTEIKKSHSWEKKKRHALTIPEQKAFTNYIANSEEYRGWYPLFTVMLGTGCRIGEVLGLRWQDIDFKNRTISINHNLVYRVQEDGSCTNHVNSPKTSAGIRIIPISSVEGTILGGIHRNGAQQVQFRFLVGRAADVQLFQHVGLLAVLQIAQLQQVGPDGIRFLVIGHAVLNGLFPPAVHRRPRPLPPAIGQQSAAGGITLLFCHFGFLLSAAARLRS